MQRIMSISNSRGRFSTLAQVSSGGISLGDDADRLGRADELAELAGNAALAAFLVGDEGGRAAVVFRQVLVPALFGKLHGHAEAGRLEVLGAHGFPAQRLDGVGHGEEEALDEGSEVDLLTEVELRALEFDDGHWGFEI
jgi:hypothetical protein